MSELMIFDSTLRDGSHAIKHQLTKQNIIDYCASMDNSGVDTIIVGHGNGLGASSLQVGFSLLTDNEMLAAAKKYLKKTKLGVYMIPGFGTINDDLIPAIDAGVELFEIGCHCTEADTTKQHIEFLANKGKEVYGVLMMYHMASPEKILEEAYKMQSYGAKGVILFDSAGRSTPEMVEKVISLLCKNLDIKVGFHPHNNIGLAVSNAYIAYKNGATIIDGTLNGFGAGAGNCPIEQFVALLTMNDIKHHFDLFKMLDVVRDVMPTITGKPSNPDPLSTASGMYGVFSAFKNPVLKIANEYNLDPRLIFKELEIRKAVAGQEDMIIEVAEALSKENKDDIGSYTIGSLS